MKFSVILFEGKLFRVRVPILRWGHGSLKFWASLDASFGLPLMPVREAMLLTVVTCVCPSPSPLMRFKKPFS